MIHGVILLEGADASGKTTLARHLVRVSGGRYLHLGPHEDIWRWHVAALRRVERLAARGLVVLDRHWPSECAYGHEYRAGPKYGAAARCLDRVLMRLGAVYVLCAPANQARQVARHAKMKKHRSEYADDVVKIVARYAALARGARKTAPVTGDDYLSQLARANRFRWRPDVMIYDLDREGNDLDGVARRLLDAVETRRRRQYAPALDPDRPNVIGHLEGATHVIVGEDVSPRAHLWAVPDWPFFSSGERMTNAGAYLNWALHLIDHDEARTLWTNALHPDHHLRELARYDLKFVCLGRAAERAAKSVGIIARRYVSHPQHARRFHYSRLSAYADELRSALAD